MSHKVMTVDELLKNSLVNFALDHGNTEMLQSLSKDEYEIVNGESNELNNKNLNHKEKNIFEEMIGRELLLRQLKDHIYKNMIIGIDFAEENDSNK